jgi:hypothetical protein
MDPAENLRATAQELVSCAQQQGIDLEPFCKECAFENGQRHIFFWRKDELPGTGPANEPLGTLHYNMQGTISVAPSKMKDFTGAFRGQWSEAGTFENLEQAFELLKAWLLDQKEVDDLPNRCVRRYMILPEAARDILA